jgi:hypothetical protein
MAIRRARRWRVKVTCAQGSVDVTRIAVHGGGGHAAPPGSSPGCITAARLLLAEGAGVLSGLS